MLTSSIMKTILMIMAALVMLCQNTYAVDRKTSESPAVQMLDSYRSARKFEGAKMKIAKPFLKKTPMSVLMDDIDMMVICPMENADDLFTENVERMLNNYSKVSEINDDSYQMYIYIDELHGNHFSELILYITRSDRSIMVFDGDFTVESLMKVGELSEQQRKQRLSSKNTKHKSFLPDGL